MKVLMLTGDKNVLREGTPAHERFLLQQSQVERLQAVYWGRGALKLPSAKGFDIVTVQDPFWRGLAGWIAARRAGAKLQVQVHTDFLEETKSSLVRHVLGQILLAHADSVRVVSERIKKQVEHYTAAPISVLPVFIDIQKFSSVVRRPHTSKNILWIGRFEEEKNPLGAIKVFKKVLPSVPDARLIMLGEGSLGKKISEQAAHLPVETPGWQSNPALYLDTADVVLCTSWHESWGASIVEALAVGIPVVAPDVGIARKAGAIVVARERLAEAVCEALHSSNRAELRLPVLNREAWAKAWRETLI